MTHKTLVELLEASRDVDRVVTYVEGENAERRVSFGGQKVGYCLPWNGCL